MSDQDRIDRLEQRLGRLEQLMRQVLLALPSRDIEPPAVAPPPPAPSAAPAPPTPPTPPEAPAAGPGSETPRRPLPPRPPLSTAAPAPKLDGEQWVGQKGLLAVGVLAVILAAGYLLKLSFDRGWISPMTRCISGALTGIAVAFGGWRLERRGYRSYGASLIGTGAAICYAVVWAASTLYGFITPFTAIALMATVALALAAMAWIVSAESLATAAVLGAFFAPLIIGDVPSDADRLLVYLASIGLALGSVTWNKRWRGAGMLIAFSYFGLGVTAADHANNAYLTLAFGALGGAAGLAAGLKFGWWETRFLSFWGGWGILAIAHNDATALLVLVAGAALSYPVWEHAFRQDGVWPFEKESSKARGILASIYFYATPFWLAWAVDELGIPFIDKHGGLAVAAVAMVYLVVGVVGPSRAFSLVAALGLTLATTMEWRDQLTTPGVLGVLTILFGGLGRFTGRRDWNLLAFLPLVSGVWLLWAGAAVARPYDSPAFVDQWALLFWGYLAMIVALATDLAAPDEDGGNTRRTVLWTGGGALLLLGVTGDLPRFFRQLIMDPSAGSLAGGLAVSVWWLLFAGALIFIGFRRTIRPLRLAGLWVSGLAIFKVIFIDLDQLDALYRVGSVFILGLVSLLVAWAYHRRARDERTDAPAER